MKQLPHPLALTTAVVLVPLAWTATEAPAATTTGVTSGTTRVTLGGPAYRTLTRAHVAVRAIGAARKRGSTIALPVATGLVGKTTILEHGPTDGLILQGPSRRVRLTAVRIRLGGSPRVVGRIDGGPRRTLFTLDRTALTVDAKAGTAGRTHVTWRLTAPAARTIRQRLRAPRLRAGRFATTQLAVRLKRATPAPAPTPTPTTPAPTTPGDVAPAALGGTVDWGVRASFRTYITGFAGGRIAASDGAAVNADGAYRWATPTGSIDPATGAVAATYRGTIYFEGHGSGDAAALRLWVRNPRIEAPAGSATGTLYADVSSKDLSAGRIVDHPNVAFATLDLAAGARATDGTTITWTTVPATLTAAGAEAFAGFYEVGAELDPVSLVVRRP